MPSLTEPDADLRKLDPRIQWIWVLYDLVGAFVLAGLALAGEAWLRKKPWWPLPLGSVSGFFLVVVGWVLSIAYTVFRYHGFTIRGLPGDLPLDEARRLFEDLSLAAAGR